MAASSQEREECIRNGSNFEEIALRVAVRQGGENLFGGAGIWLFASRRSTDESDFEDRDERGAPSATALAFDEATSTLEGRAPLQRKWACKVFACSPRDTLPSYFTLFG